MPYQSVGIALIAFIYFVVKYLNRTDVPKIKNLPEVPGVPLFGNLLQFGSSHPKVARALAEKLGPVYQVRLGNRVSDLCSLAPKRVPFSSEDREQYTIQSGVDTFTLGLRGFVTDTNSVLSSQIHSIRSGNS
jgi:hypothetical protein